MNDRCYLVYAVAPRGTSARAANDALNDYVGDHRRGVPAFHDHFTRVPHGGIAVFHVRSDDELAALAEPGPLAGWTLAVHALTFSLTAVGFSAQTEFTVEAYAQTSLAALRAAEHDDPRHWWRRPRARFPQTLNAVKWPEIAHPLSARVRPATCAGCESSTAAGVTRSSTRWPKRCPKPLEIAAVSPSGLSPGRAAGPMRTAGAAARTATVTDR
jgi:hypothetical protein